MTFDRAILLICEAKFTQNIISAMSLQVGEMSCITPIGSFHLLPALYGSLTPIFLTYSVLLKKKRNVSKMLDRQGKQVWQV